jgi:outer membrane protein TolC
MKALLPLLILLGAWTNARQMNAAVATNAVVVTAGFLKALAEEARTNAPALRAERSRVEAARAHAAAVRTWEDPVFTFGGVTARRSIRADDGDLILRVEQKLPLFGKPAAARRAAESEVVTQQVAETVAFQRLQLEIAKQAYKTALADRAVELAQEDAAWLDALALLAEQQFLIGKISRVDVLKAQTERARRTEQILTEKERRAHERVVLNRLLNRDFAFAWPRLELPALAGPIGHDSRLTDLALGFEPQLRLLRREVEAGLAAAEVTRLKRLPEFGVGIEGRAFTGNGEFRQGMVFFNMNLPFWNLDKYRAEHARDLAKVRASEHAIAESRLHVAKEVHEIVTTLAAARREALLQRDQVLPRAALAISSARIAWETERGMFRDVLEARRMLIEGHLMYARAVAEQHTLLAQLSLVCGETDAEALQQKLGESGDIPAKP